MKRPILGIDPGINGALFLLRPDETFVCHDVPTLDIKPRRAADLTQLALLFDGFAKEAPTVWIEQVCSRPTDGHVQAFSFGGIYYALQAMAAAHFMPIGRVAPVKWRRAMGLAAGEDKDCSRARASALLPRGATCWPLKKHDGRAEAALIALYGTRQPQATGEV